MLTLTQLEMLSGIGAATLSNRLKQQGKTVEQAIKMGPSQKEFLEIGEEKLSRIEFCEKFNIDLKVYYENHKNMNLEELIDQFGSRPIQGQN